MKKNRLNWALLVMLIWARQSSQYSCEDAKECPCTYPAPDEYIIYCPNGSTPMITVDITSKKSGSVRCETMAVWSDLKINSTTEAEDVSVFSFKDCSLPDSSLHEITRRIGVQPKDRLDFESNRNLSSTLKRRHLSGFPKIKELSLSFNGLTELPSDLLTDLPELTGLELQGNSVILSPEFFDAVPKLQGLELRNNKLRRIDPVLFQSLKNLKFLSLRDNKLTNLEKDVFENLTALSILEISNNHLETLHPEVFRPLGNLSGLHMSGNYFSPFPEDLLLRNLDLTAISLARNRGDLSTFPNGFLSNLPKLKDVNFMSAKLEVLPEDIFWGSSSITNIKLTENLLSTLPMNIFKDSKNLKSLDLSSNRLSDLPDRIFKSLSKLEKLDLQRNHLASISGMLFSGLSGLIELNLEFNGLRTIASDSFSHLESLRIARLSHNQLTLEKDRTTSDDLLSFWFANPSPFSNCRNLRELHLAFNNITEIFDDWKFVLTHLRILDLEYNKISILKTEDFQFLSRNIEINMRNNNISRIDLEIAEILAMSQGSSPDFDSMNVRILIQENPIICDCNLYHFIKYLNGEMHPNVQKMFHIIPGNLRCAGPKWMQEILLSDLKSTILQCPFANCPEKCECWIRRSDFTVTANCSHRSLTTAPERISYEHGNIVLDLTDNLLNEVPYINQSGYGNITKLLLSHNDISSVSPDNIPTTLEVLELHDNNLMRLDAEVLERFRKSASLEDITLHGNPWRCDCAARDLLCFVQSRYEKIRNFPNITCYSNSQPMTDMTVVDLCSGASAGTIVGMRPGVKLLGLLAGILGVLHTVH